MNDGSEAQTPIFLLSALQQRFPQFSEKDASKGVWKQQDANEAWLAICQFLQTLKVFFTFDDFLFCFQGKSSLISELIEFKTVTKIAEEGVEESDSLWSIEQISDDEFVVCPNCPDGTETATRINLVSRTKQRSYSEKVSVNLCAQSTANRPFSHFFTVKLQLHEER